MLEGASIADLQSPEIFLDPFARMLDFAECTYLSRHPAAAAPGSQIGAPVAYGETKSMFQWREWIRLGPRKREKWRIHVSLHKEYVTYTNAKLLFWRSRRRKMAKRRDESLARNARKSGFVRGGWGRQAADLHVTRLEVA